MAVPKRRLSRANTHARRSQWKTTVPTLAVCPNRACGALTPPHQACTTCGQYKGRQIVGV